MPLEIPNLDDRNFSDLVTEARSMIPQYAPEWTNHNPSDPGITLIELLAYVSEMLIYRLNRVTRESRIRFLKLLRQVEPEEQARLADPETPLAEIDEALRQAVLELRQLQRAVTAQDYENLIKNLATPSNQRRVMRSHCFHGMKPAEPTVGSPIEKCPGHVSVVIVPENDLTAKKLDSLLQRIRNELEPMRLLATRLHVVPPFYLWLSLGVEIGIQHDADFDRVRSAAIDKVHQFFSPLPDDRSDSEGWPFGRPIYLSEIYAQLEAVPGVDYVQNVRVLRMSENGKAIDDDRNAVGIQIGIPAASTVGLNTRIGGKTSDGANRLVRDTRGRLIVVGVKPYELVRIVVRPENLLPAEV